MMGPHPQVRPAAPPALPPPTSPSSHRSYPLLQPFMSPRYPGGPRPALRMNQVRFPPAVRPRWGTELLQGSRCALTPPPPQIVPLQPPVGVPGSQPLLPNAMDPAARAQGEWGSRPQCCGGVTALTPTPPPSAQGIRTWGAQCSA